METKEQRKPKTIVLPSGRTAIVRAGTGDDFAKALIAVNGNGCVLTLVLVTRMATVEGEVWTYDRLLSEPLPDVLVLNGTVNEMCGPAAFEEELGS